MYYLFGVFFLILSILESIFKKVYGAKLLLIFISWILLFILLGFNEWSPDFDNYKDIYSNYDIDIIKYTIEPFFLFLIKLSNAGGLAFSKFLIIIGLITISIIILTVKKLTLLPVFVLANFFFLPFFPDIVQIRFLLGFTIFIYSLLYFEKRRFIFYSLLTIAILTHYTLFVFLLFLILRKFNFYNKVIKSNLLIILSVFLLLLIPKSIVKPIIEFLNPKYLFYLDSEATYFGTIILFIPFFTINTAILLYHKYRFYKIENKIPQKYICYIPLIIQLIQFSNYMILLQYFVRDFSRITMNIYLLCLVYISIIIGYGIDCEYNKEKVFFYKVFTFITTLIIYYTNFLMVNNGKYIEVIEKTFNSNSLF